MDDNPSDDDQNSCEINSLLEMYIKAKREQLSELLECLSDHIHSDFISESTSFDDHYPHGDERSYLYLFGVVHGDIEEAWLNFFGSNVPAEAASDRGNRGSHM